MRKKFKLSIEVCDYETGLEVPEALISVKREDGMFTSLCSTGENKGSLVLDDLEPGDYLVQQKEAAAGYLIDPNQYRVTVGKTMTTSMYLLDHKNINFRIEKTCFVDMKQPLVGVTYTIRKPDNTLVGTYSTDEKGRIELLLDPGEYIVTEVYSPMMKMDTQEHHIVVNADRIAELKSSSELRVGPAIKPDDKAEFVGQIIDIFEDFLEARGIQIQNDEKDNDDDVAIIYGSDYGELQTALEAMMKNWELMD